MRMAYLSGDLLILLLLLVSSLQICLSQNRPRRQGFVFESGSSSTGESCSTRDGQQGVCIEVVKCDEATSILSGSPTPAQRRFLQERTCRFDGGTPFFCCVTGRTGGQPDTAPPPTTAPQTPPPPPPPPVTAAPPATQERGKTLAELDQVCGKSTRVGTRVVGGVPAVLNAWPWMAAIFIADRGNILTNEVSCGGVLLSDFYILTAAHCAVNKDTRKTRANSEFLVRLGDLDIGSTTDGATPIDFDVTEVIPHADYNQDAVKNDIALLRLAKPVTFSEAMTPICLPTSTMVSNKFERSRPFIAGWGTIQFQGESSSILRQVQLEVTTNSECQRAFQSFRVTISNTQLCAGFPLGGKDACQGDSGGPLMQMVSEKWYTIGVVSVGFRCAEPGFPGIYTRTTEYLDWIKTNAKLQ